MALISVIAQKLGIGKGPKKGSQIGVFVIDATLSESHTRESEPSKNPVEEGVDITDHVDVKPAEVTIEGLVSDTPLSLESSLAGGITAAGAAIGKKIGGSLGSAIGGVAAGSILGLLKKPENRVQNAYKHFKDLLAKRVPFEIVTGLDRYQNMIITSLEVNRDPTTGQALKFKISAIEIRFVKSQVVTLPKSVLNVIHSAGKRANLGQQTKKEVTGPKRSLLVQGGIGAGVLSENP